MSHTIEKSALVWYSARQMYDLVNDIDRYPEFLPWCADTEIHESGPTEIVASIDVARSGVRHRLTTRNRLDAPETIDMSLVDGPFQSLTGGWRFQPLDHNACKVMLVLDFAFTGSLSRMTFGKVFSQAANTMVDAFCQRAVQVYGNQA